jgi:transposase InsO family protein
MLQRVVFWSNMSQDVRSFVQSCLHCLSSAEGEKVPRPLSSQEHASAPNAILHFDFLYVTPSIYGTYVLVLKDDFSNFVRLILSRDATSQVVSSALVDWFACFGLVQKWVSDQGSHFMNELLEDLAARLGARHHFVTTYTPWANGSVEVLNRVILRTLRALLSELRLSENKWGSLLPLVQLAMNTAPSRRLKGRTPMEVHTGREPAGPLSAAVTWPLPNDFSHARFQEVTPFEELQSAIETMHRDVEENISAERRRQIESFNQKRHVQPENFSVGDFVLVSLVEGRRSKVSPTWVGPRRVISLRPHKVCLVESLLTKARTEVHVSHMRLYRDSLNGTASDMTALAEYGDRRFYAVERVVDLREGPSKAFEAQVRWKGFTAKSDTWEPLLQLYEDIPEMVRSFLSDRRQKPSTRRTQQLVDRALQAIADSPSQASTPCNSP